MLIALDHGNKSIKCSGGKVFSSGLNESTTQPPFGTDILRYNGKFYSVSDQRIPYQKDKSLDDRFYVLSLFGIAYELEAANAPVDDITDITLLIGLPPAHYGSLYERFEDYFTRGRQIEEIVFNGKRYFICIKESIAYPQAYAAAMQVYNQIRIHNKAVVIDLGGMTLDYILLKSGKADLSVCDSLENGVIVMYNKIKSKVSADYDLLLDESDIDVVLNGHQNTYGENVNRLINDMAQSFVNDIFSKLRERMIDLRTCKPIFVGGGSILLRKQIADSGKASDPLFVNDIDSNAKGYEMLYNLSKTNRLVP